MKHILLDGGFTKGGFNFDAKLRRQSINVEDLFIGHIGGIDVLARALTIAIKMIEDKFLENFKKERYKKWQEKEGQEILSGKLTLEDLAKGATNPNPKSGNQELLEKYINDVS